MEEFKALLLEQWPQVLSYGLTIVAYFLVFLNRSWFDKIRNNMKMIFTEKVAQVDNLNKKAMDELIEAKRVYTEKIEEYAKLIKDVARLKDVVKEMLVQEDVDNG